MRSVREVIVVEGRYDKNTVLQAVNATVVETAGFGIFSDSEKLSLLKRLAENRGIIVLTDSDGAGFVIRNHIKGALGSGVKHAYIPDIAGKERRKRAPSREGKLGVEGMKPEVIIAALERAGATFDDSAAESRAGNISKADMYELGLSGTDGSAERRLRLQQALDLPQGLSAKGLLDVLNVLYTKDELEKKLAEM